MSGQSISVMNRVASPLELPGERRHRLVAGSPPRMVTQLAGQVETSDVAGTECEMFTACTSRAGEHLTRSEQPLHVAMEKVPTGHRGSKRRRRGSREEVRQVWGPLAPAHDLDGTTIGEAATDRTLTGHPSGALSVTPEVPAASAVRTALEEGTHHGYGRQDQPRG